MQGVQVEKEREGKVCEVQEVQQVVQVVEGSTGGTCTGGAGREGTGDTEGTGTGDASTRNIGVEKGRTGSTSTKGTCWISSLMFFLSNP